MVNQQLLDYIKQQLEQGVSQEQIKNSLLSVGWSEADIEEGFRLISSSTTPAVTPPIYSEKITENQQKAVFAPSETKSTKNLIIIISVILILAAGSVFGFYTFYKSLHKEIAQTPETSTSSTQVTVTTPTSSPSFCDSYDCLIAAAAKCEPISATISYSGIPSPLFPGILASGQTYYEIQQTANINECVLKFSSLSTSFSLSEEGREDALKQGMTEAQINMQLEAMNESAKLTAGIETICTSTPSIIVAYLTDFQKGNIKVETQFGLSGEGTVTYTTSNGQELNCISLPLPGQPANTTKTITDEECRKQKGFFKPVKDDGTACSKNEIDLGSVVGSVKLNGKYPQCCVPQ